MSRSGVSAVGVAFGIALMLSVVAVKMQALDFQEHSQYDARLVHLKELDAQLNADVLESRFELATSYDALVADLAGLKITEDQLLLAPTFVDEQDRGELSRLLTSHVQAVEKKADLIERFKSENAILRNSLHYLPVIYSEFGPTAPAGVNDIVRDVLLYNLTGDPTVAAGVRARLDLIPAGDSTDESSAEYQLHMLFGHTGIILASKPVLDGLIADMVAVPTLPRAEALRSAYARDYERALDWANIYRLMLLGLALILLVCTVSILARLRRATVERNAANAGLVSRHAELRRSEARKAAILESALDAMVVVDADGVVSEFNPAAERTFGYTRAEAIGTTLAELVVSIGPGREIGELLATSTDAAPIGKRLLGIGRRHEGTEIPLELAVIQIDCDGPPIFTAYLRDISEQRHAEQALQHQAHHDGLTDLPNRTVLHQRLEDAVADGHQVGLPVALLIMDLDRFKEVNDTLGHHAGDALLRLVAARLQATRRAGDTVARLGGDEFAILLPGANIEAAYQRAARLLKDLTQPFTVEERVLDIGASVGIALYPEHGADAATLLRHADVALYVAKRQRSGSVVYTPEQDMHSATRLGLAGELRKAIENGELVLFYQPIIGCRSGRVTSLEALVRWRHPHRGLLLPDHFIPLCEETGVIDLLSRWVIEAALRQMHTWHDDAIDLPVAVNLSMRNLQDQQLPEAIALLLVQYGVPPAWLTLEITESAVMADPERAVEVLGRLREIGVAIDDFGTGYSSLAYLKRLPVDLLKIDRSFTLNVCTDRSDLAIVRSVIELGHQLDLQLIAEGVEDEASWSLLVGLGCDEGQGYLFSRPLEAEAVAHWVRQPTALHRAQIELLSSTAA
jgi:diguanylate cyclase (GGDEF)-like protein/PAS domain S-box-containing protein